MLVVDPSEAALMLGLMSDLNPTLYMHGRFLQMDELRDLMLQLFKIPREQCKALGWLYAASRLEEMPRVDTILLSGADASVHCYIYARYASKAWTPSFSPQNMH